MNARRKDDDGKWCVAAWHGDGYMWATVIASAAAELDAAQETDAAKDAALTAVLAVKSVEPTCPLRAALRTWETRTGLDRKQINDSKEKKEEDPASKRDKKSTASNPRRSPSTPVSIT